MNFGYSYRSVNFKDVSIRNVNFRDESPGLQGGLISDLNPVFVHAACHIGLEPVDRPPRGSPACPPAAIFVTVARSCPRVRNTVGYSPFPIGQRGNLHMHLKIRTRIANL